ncbi:alkaline phosphatase PhoX [Planktothrix mougeotii]|uniref:alkaline phosphatase PhoX n=1 Tax=Planktothrix mougeotii TaxID=54306 RepID=UPI0004BC6F33
MSVNRRDFLLFLGAGFTTLAVGSCQNSSKIPKIISSPEPKFTQSLPFKPIKGPLPNSLDLIQAQTSKSVIPVSDNSLSAQQIQAYSTYEIVDDLVLPEGFTYDVIATWGDKVGNSRFGYNNDYVSFIATGENQGFLTVNFEYISAEIWLETYQQVIGKTLPLKKIQSDQNKKLMLLNYQKKTYYDRIFYNYPKQD